MTSNVEQQLRDVMESAVAGLTPPGDLASRVKRHHRRRSGRTGLAVAAGLITIVLASNLLADSLWSEPRPAPAGAAGTGNGMPPEPPGGLASPGPNAVAWPYRGGLYVEGDNDIDRRAVAKWAQIHQKQPGETTANPLFGVELPSRQKVLIFQITELAGGPAHTSVYVEPANSTKGALVRDDVLSANPLQITQVIDGGENSYLIVLTSPSNLSIVYTPDGSHAASPLRLGDTQGRGGWAVYSLMGSASGAATVTIKKCPNCPALYQGPVLPGA